MMKRLPYLMLFLAVLAVPLRASPPIGAVVQDSHYDSAKGVVTFSILNTSNKDISALNLLVRLVYPDGTAGTREYGNDFLPFMAENQGNGAIAPGAIFTIDVPLGQQQIQTASATVDLVVYADDTADVLNEQAFASIAAQRKGWILGYQKANELLQKALADSNDPHPSTTVAAQLKALAKQYETNPPAGGAIAGLGLLDAATNISNAPKSYAGRSEKEDDFLRKIIKIHQGRISLFLPHTQITKGVRP
jgi:hypothetical protein